MDKKNQLKNITKNNLGIIGGTITFLIIFITIGYITITIFAPTGGVGDSFREIALYAFLFGAFILSTFIGFQVYNSISSN